MNKHLPVFLLIFFSMFVTCGCHSRKASDTSSDTLQNNIQKTEKQKYKYSESELILLDYGLVDIHSLDSTIQVQLMYATADNFMHSVMYEDIHNAFFLPALAEKIVKAQAQLKRQHPDYSLIIYDAARPVSVQKKMYKMAESMGKTEYVANPNKGEGLHNYGAAVDISIVDASGKPLPMGTPFDWFGPEAHITDEPQLVADSLISQQELDNRLLLRKLMTDNGLLTIRNEWWHFELMRAAKAKQQLKILQ